MSPSTSTSGSADRRIHRVGAIRRAALGLAVALAGAACSGDAGGGPDGDPPGMSGVRGVVVVDAGCPPTAGERACPTGPLAARLRFVAEGGGPPAREVVSGPDGTFSVVLPPGRYDVLPDNEAGALYPRADPATVEVHEGRFTELTIRFDSGVR